MENKKKEKDPAFLFYSQDWLVGTMFMTMEERGIFITLLAHQHQKGYLTTDMIYQITHGVEYPAVMEKFVQEDNGNWINIKLGKEIMRRKKYAEDQKSRALKRWKKDAVADAIAYAEQDAVADAIAYAELDAHVMPRVETETVTGTVNKSYKTSKTKSPKTIFHNQDQTQNYNSLEDLYNDLP